MMAMGIVFKHILSAIHLRGLSLEMVYVNALKDNLTMLVYVEINNAGMGIAQILKNIYLALRTVLVIMMVNVNKKEEKLMKLVPTIVHLIHAIMMEIAKLKMVKIHQTALTTVL
jgi:phosphate uptake regulator